ncbi:MAG: hypothetical protein LBD45_03275, partial [Bacteroidales bacterium]|jgi:hypothetical protein|nr:hypothetical protein [Bacteroidales bacterium]
MGEDQLFSIQAIRQAKTLAYTPWLIHHYHIRNNSAMDSFSYQRAISQLETAAEIKKILDNASDISEAEILFYKRYINLFVIYQYFDCMLRKDDKRNLLKIIKKDLKHYHLNKLYPIPLYRTERSNVTIYNRSITLYFYYIRIKRGLAKMIKRTDYE